MDVDRLETLAESLALVFYVLIPTALVMTLVGSVGSGVVLLILGSCAHVGRASLEEFVERTGGHRAKPESRAKADRATARRRSARRAAA
ncbi:MAG TPA: hypothetical protein VH275_11315 [Solirubrobacterales bacterium]|nr:hypothetical protein [Solirubrobacterales bacterium]